VVFVTSATKKNLLDTIKSLALARKGHDLLDMKYAALLREVKAAEKEAAALRGRVGELRHAAERAVTIAQMEMGEGYEPAEELVLHEGCIAGDAAFFVWLEFEEAKNELAEMEAALLQLKAKKERTRRRVFALKNIKIPTYESQIKYISEQLEERERDDMTRLRSFTYPKMK
jgi:V/A-type H+-transporting ATPase subunit D